jgi:hypothetical protein
MGGGSSREGVRVGTSELGLFADGNKLDYISKELG